MGRRGPAPTPTLLKLAKGERRPSRVNYEEPQLPAPDSTEPPAGLEGQGLAEWKRLVPQLAASGHLTVADMAGFEDYCRALTDLRTYEARQKKAGPELAIAKGYAGMTVKLRAQVAQYRSRLGLDPTSRSSVKAARKQEESPRDRASRYMSAIRGGRA